MHNPFADPPAAPARPRVNSNPFEVSDSQPAATNSNNPFEEEDGHSGASVDSADDDDTPKWLRSAASEVGVDPVAAPSAYPAVLGRAPPVLTNAAVAAAASASVVDVNPFASPVSATEPPPTRFAVPPDVGTAFAISERAAAPTSEHSPPSNGSGSPGGQRGAASASPPVIEVEPPCFAADMSRGCAALLGSGRHADVSFELPARTLRAHRCLLEARCGAPVVEALEGGALGAATMEEGVLKITLPVDTVGDASGASLAALLLYVYTERFDKESLAGRGGAIALLRLVARLEQAGSSVALERLRQLCERELAAATVPETLVATAHEAAELGAEQLLQFCLHSMRVQFDKLYASGAIGTLSTPLCAELFALRSAAVLQDALSHERVDVATYTIEHREADSAEAMVRPPPFRPPPFAARPPLPCARLLPSHLGARCLPNPRDRISWVVSAICSFERTRTVALPSR